MKHTRHAAGSAQRDTADSPVSTQDRSRSSPHSCDGRSLRPACRSLCSPSQCRHFASRRPSPRASRPCVDRCRSPHSTSALPKLCRAPSLGAQRLFSLRCIEASTAHPPGTIVRASPVDSPLKTAGSGKVARVSSSRRSLPAASRKRVWRILAQHTRSRQGAIGGINDADASSTIVTRAPFSNDRAQAWTQAWQTDPHGNSGRLKTIVSHLCGCHFSSCA